MQSNGSQCGALSLLSPIGYQRGDCGYCKGEQTSRTPDSRASYYARCKSLCPDHYQELMDRGWRRSGALLYLPDVSRSCCPHYTIRLPAHEFQPTRDQRQALHRWNRFVLGEKYTNEVNKKYPKSKEEKKRQKNTFDMIATVHESEYSNLKPDIEPEHALEVTLEPDTFTEEKYELFHNYQDHVHHESDAEISREGFTRFLCGSPLHRHDIGNKKVGSFHQMYRLDGRLIAMSVLDLLPHSVSGVYFIYHSDFEIWSFGKLSAVREAALAIEEGYGLYYMGYFIWNCKKMRYKGDYRPQNVLDYDTLEWDVMDDEMRRLMDKRKWVSMSRERKIKEVLDRDEDTNMFGSQERDEAEEAIAARLYCVFMPNPLEATESGISILYLGLPGAVQLELLEEEINLDEMKILTRRIHPRLMEMQDLEGWGLGSILDNRTSKGIIAEYAACVGPNLAGAMVVDGRS